MKKYFALLALLAAAATTWGADFTAVDVNGNDIYYNIIDADAHEVEVTYTGSSGNSNSKYEGDLVIPETVEHDGVTYTVTCLGDSAMFFTSATNAAKLTSLSLPTTINTIGTNALHNCQLTKLFAKDDDEDGTLRIPSHITTIYTYAFYYCTQFTKVIIEDSTEPLTHICTSSTQGAFRGCSNLTSLYWGRDVIWDSRYAPWNNLSGITDVEIGEQVTTFPEGSFYGLGFTEFTFPSNVKEINTDYLFYSCSNLKSVELPDFIEKVGNSMFYSCSALEEVSIPEGVTMLDYRAFYGCTSLKSITIPSTVTELGEQVFYGGTSDILSLETLVSLAPEPPTCGTNALGKVQTESCVLKVPEGSTDSYSSANQWKSFTSIEEIVALATGTTFSQDGITYEVQSKDDKTIAVSTQEDSYTGSIVIPSKVTYDYITYTVSGIAASTFANSTGLEEVTIPSSVEKIGDSAFSGCTALARVFEERSTPPTLGNDVFENVPATCWLIVDDEAKSAYTTAEETQWQAFGVIMGLNPVVVTSTEVQDITRYTATFAATYEVGYNATIEQGFEYWAEGTGILTIAGTLDEEETTMTATVETLSAGTQYTFRAYAKTAEGTVRGEEVTFTTEHIPPTVCTAAASAVTSTSVVLNGSVEIGTEALLAQGFVYWTDEEETIDIVDDSGEETMTITLTDLDYGTDYAYYAYATTESGTIVGETMTFTTLIDAPTVETYAATNITETSALVKGYVAAGSEEIQEQGFEYWIEDDEENVTTVECADEVIAVTLGGLDAATTYHFRAYAITERLGTTAGEEYTFTTDEAPATEDTTGISSLTLDDSNIEGYYTVAGQKIDSPAKGLTIIRYRDGTTKTVIVK